MCRVTWLQVSRETGHYRILKCRCRPSNTHFDWSEVWQSLYCPPGKFQHRSKKNSRHFFCSANICFQGVQSHWLLVDFKILFFGEQICPWCVRTYRASNSIYSCRLEYHYRWYELICIFNLIVHLISSGIPYSKYFIIGWYIYIAVNSPVKKSVSYVSAMFHCF